MTLHHSELESLFDVALPAPLYSDAAADIAAVRDGAKHLSFFVLPRSAVEEIDETFEAVLHGAQEARAFVVLRDDELSTAPGGEVCVFVHRAQEGWRVPALMALRSLMGRYPWSDGLEAFQSVLLGYSEDQIAQWLALQRERGIAWGLTHVYMLMPSRWKDAVIEHGGRAFPDSLAGHEQLLCFASRSRRLLRRDVASCVLPDSTLARVSVSIDNFRVLFHESLRQTHGDVVRVQLSTSRLRSLNSILESRFEFLQ